MQQPFAAAMAAGVGLHTRRGKPAAFLLGGEWVAIHCGQNEEHLRNAALMASFRRAWPACPPDAALRAGQRCVLGVARFVDGACDARAAAAADPLLALYSCAKPTAWRADAARACAAPMPYPKGNLQLWHVSGGGFSRPADGAQLLELAASAAAAAGAARGKKREACAEPPCGAAAAGAAPHKAAKR
jgi:hypothetical protein